MDRLAVVELNEIGLKLSIMNVSNGKYKLLKEDEINFDLYREVQTDKLLKPKTISDLISTLKIFKKIIDENGAERVVAFVSDFLQKARNQKGFLDEVYNNTNISFSYMPTEERVKHIYTSVVNSIDCSKGHIFNIDVNSVTIVKFNRRTTLGSLVLPIGYASILEDEKGNKRNYEQIENYIYQKLKESEFVVGGEEESACIGLGLPFINLGRIVKKMERDPLNIDNNYPVSQEAYLKAEKFMLDLDLEKVKRIKGIIAPSTDVLFAELAIIKGIYRYFKPQVITISTANLRDGIVKNSIEVENADKYNDLITSSFENYREFLPWDTSVNLRVNNMAGILFKQLKVMHKLPRNYIKALRVAAFMFNSGKIISYEDYERHGFYTILNSNLAGVTQKDLLLGAFTCLCQIPDNFNLADWVKYQSILTEEDLDAVRKMGIIIKLAVALNSSKEQTVTDIVCDMLGDSVIMKTISTLDASYDILQGHKVADDYRKMFKKNLQLI